MNTHFNVELQSEKLEAAFEHTSAGWFPINPEILDTIRKRIQVGHYENDMKMLIDDLRCDYALYLHCVRKLQRLVCIRKVEESKKTLTGDETSAFRFSDIFADFGIEDIQTILDESRRSSSIHRLAEVSATQESRLREVLLSTSTARALAQRFNIDPEIGYTCALMRQLGLTLIAWNYPNVYRKALQLLSLSLEKTPRTLDTILHSRLGFFPEMLGVRFARSWGIPDTALTALKTADDTEAALRSLTENQAETLGRGDRCELLAQLCEVGEALARANSPEEYPSARSDWEGAKRALQHHLDRDGIELILSEVKRLTELYSPQFEAPNLTELEDRIASLAKNPRAGVAHPLERNPYLKTVPLAARQRIEDLYAELQREKISDELVRELLAEVVPLAGFLNAKIFTVDPSTNSLVSSFSSGKPTVLSVSSVKIDFEQKTANPLIKALNEKTPLWEPCGMTSGKQRSFVVGGFGRKTPLGVLYVELDESAPREVHQFPVFVFKAILVCLHHLLHLW